MPSGYATQLSNETDQIDVFVRRFDHSKEDRFSEGVVWLEDCTAIVRR